MQRTTRRRLGRALLVLFALMGVAQTTYLAVAGWERQTPVWARAVAFCFPLATTGLFGWYLRRYAAHEHSAVLFAYAGVGTFLGGFAYALPGVGLTIQQQTIGRPILNPGVLLVELWLGGGLLGLAIGHFYGVSLGERRTLERRESAVERHRQRLTVLNRVLRHDIRNDLNVARGILDLVREAEYLDEDHAERLDTATAHVDDVLEKADKARYVERTLRQSRVTETTLASVVGRARERVAASRPDAEIRAVGDLDLAVVADTNLDIALTELCLYALRTQDDDPRVTVTVAADPAAGVHVDVSYPGPPVSANDREVLDHGTETQLRHCQGLGLWLATWIVENGRGTLDVPGDADHQFRLRLRRPTAPVAG